MIRWRYEDFTMTTFQEGTASLMTVAPGTHAVRVGRYANGLTQHLDSVWRMDPIRNFGHRPQVALTWRTANSAQTGVAAWEVAMHSHENSRNVSMPFTFTSLADTATLAGDRVYMTVFTTLTLTGYATPAADVWWTIRVQRKTAGDTINDDIDLMNFSLRYRVER